MPRVTCQCGFLQRHQISVLILVGFGLGGSPKGAGAKPKSQTKTNVCIGVTPSWNEEGSRHSFNRSYDCDGRAVALVRSATYGTRDEDGMNARRARLFPSLGGGGRGGGDSRGGWRIGERQNARTTQLSTGAQRSQIVFASRILRVSSAIFRLSGALDSSSLAAL